MLDLELIDNTIEELEADDTNFNNCFKLASLYIIKDYHKSSQPEIENDSFLRVHKELDDILPHYEVYCKLKTDYQLGKIGKEPVIQSLASVSKEIEEFIQTLYNSTDMPEERELLQNMADRISHR